MFLHMQNIKMKFQIYQEIQKIISTVYRCE